jgi:hypothetical protein
MLTVELPLETPPPTTLKDREPVVRAKEELWGEDPPEDPPEEGLLTRPENWELVVSTTAVPLPPRLVLLPEEPPELPPPMDPEEERVIPEEVVEPDEVDAVVVVEPEDEAVA